MDTNLTVLDWLYRDSRHSFFGGVELLIQLTDALLFEKNIMGPTNRKARNCTLCKQRKQPLYSTEKSPLCFCHENVLNTLLFAASVPSTEAFIGFECYTTCISCAKTHSGKCSSQRGQKVFHKLKCKAPRHVNGRFVCSRVECTEAMPRVTTGNVN